MNNCVLNVERLVVQVADTKIINKVQIQLNQGEGLAIIGESGSGKTTIIKAILGILANEYTVDIDLTKSNIKELKLGSNIVYLPQNMGEVFSPIRLLSKQLKDSKIFYKERFIEYCAQLNLPTYKDSFRKYPYEFSLGEIQRIAIASIVSSASKLIILDEPTSAIDNNTQNQLLQLLNDTIKLRQKSILLCSHDRYFISRLKLPVQRLVHGSLLPLGQENTNVFAPKVYHKNKGDWLVEANDLAVYYGSQQVFKNVNFTINDADIVCLVGSSGIGKSTLAHLIVGIKQAQIVKEGGLSFKRSLVVQIVLQDYLSSFTPGKTVFFLLLEALKYNKKISNKFGKIRTIIKHFKKLDLAKKLLFKSVCKLSLGQAQRVAVIRAVLFKPDLLILDEPTSALDQHNEQLMINYLREAHEQRVALLIISHSIKLVQQLATKVIELPQRPNSTDNIAIVK